MSASEQSQNVLDDVLPGSRVDRRWLLKSGAMLVPTIVTLHARSALAQSGDGTMHNPFRVLNQAYTGGVLYAGARYGASPVRDTFEAYRIEGKVENGPDENAVKNANENAQGVHDRPADVFYRTDSDGNRTYFTWRD